MGYAIGADLGGTNLRVAAVDEAGALLEKRVIPTDAANRTVDRVLDAMCAAIDALVDRHEGSRPLHGVGVGVPGILDFDAGVLRASPSLPGWRDVPVRAALETRLRRPILLDNDANLAAVGEHWRGAGRGDPEMCMLTLGTGVGGAILRGGHPWRGAHGMAGELGHWPLHPDGPPCTCGARGCLERYASATAVARLAREAVERDGAPSLAGVLDREEPAAVARRVHELALAGDAFAREVYRQVGVALGIALAGLVNALDLSTYVLGGGVSCAWGMFAPALFEEVRRRSFVYATVGDGTRIVRAEMPHDAGLYGACRAVFALAGVP
jgi:glucokinase